MCCRIESDGCGGSGEPTFTNKRNIDSTTSRTVTAASPAIEILNSQIEIRENNLKILSLQNRNQELESRIETLQNTSKKSRGYDLRGV
jgi:hypothetical protein